MNSSGSGRGNIFKDMTRQLIRELLLFFLLEKWRTTMSTLHTIQCAIVPSLTASNID